MAEGVKKVSEADDGRELQPLRARDRGFAHGRRFTLAYMLLVIAFGGVMALFTYLAVRPASEPWSTFKPDGDGIARATQIANEVSRKYRQGDEQIAIVQAQPPIVENTAVDAVAIARDQSEGVGGGFVSLEPAQDTILYVFCGFGSGCSLPGESSQERGRLLRRESLELALYTFKYMKGIDSVVTLLPPVRQVTPAVYLRRRALLAELERPLRMTLPGRPPFTVESLIDVGTVERLTAHRFFPSRFQQLPSGRAILVLGGRQPPPPPAQQQQQQQQQPSQP